MTKRSEVRSGGDDIFAEFDRLFEDIQHNMDMMRVRSGSTPESMPLSYSYQVEIGSDGERHVTERYGDAARDERAEDEASDLLVDVLEREDRVTVLMQIPGVAQEDIALEVVGKFLTVRVDNASLQFEREVELPCEVKPSSVQAMCRNGVLEVTMGRTALKRRGGKKVKAT